MVGVVMVVWCWVVVVVGGCSGDGGGGVVWCWVVVVGG